MRVLISAYACEPGKGSEPGVGWNVLRELSARHELTVITRANHQHCIFSSGESWTERVSWVFVDPPEWTLRLKRLPGMMRWFYLCWQRVAFREGARRHDDMPFDLAHHLTFGTVLPASPFVELGIPFACGPLGGAERMPIALFADLPSRMKWREWLRDSAREWALRWPILRRSYSDAECLAATEESADWLRAAGATRVKVCPQSGIGEGEALARVRAETEGDICFVTACRLIHWKGMDLVIDAFAELQRRGVKARLIVLQDGPEELNLRTQARKLGVADRVDFKGRLGSLEEVHDVIGGADAFIHAAWHEAFGQACLEARALGVPLIAFNHGGPGIIGEGAGSILVEVGSRVEMIEGLARAMIRMSLEPEVFSERARLEVPLVREKFAWKRVAMEVEGAWNRALLHADELGDSE